MSRFRIPRRTFLAGVGGTAVWLPFLEAMEGRRAHASSHRRYLVCFAGTSLGQSRTNQLVPNTVGPGYDLKRALAPLGETNTMNSKFGAYNVRNEVTVVSGMKIPWGSTPPPGGRVANWHSSSMSPLLSGVRSTSASPSCRGVTSDQLVAAAIGQGSRFRSLEYRVQAAGYRGGESKGVMSFRKDSTGRIVPNTPVASPKLAFETLFTGFGTGDATETRRREALLAQDKSILDLVRGRADRLKATLGTTDRTRLERHFDEIRDLERRIATVPALQGATCKVPADPGADPRISTTQEDGRAARTIGYADEELRGKVLSDLVHMAFACNLTRSVSLMLTYAQSFMNVEALVGVRTDLHETGHGSASLDKMSDTIAWQVGLWARIVAKLRDTPDAGGSLLDSSALVLVFEGGHGFDPESGNAAAAHSSENMAVLVAGRAGGLKPGRHIVARDAHPAQAIVSCMNAVGVPGGLGEVTEGLPELFR